MLVPGQLRAGPGGRGGGGRDPAAVRRRGDGADHQPGSRSAWPGRRCGRCPRSTRTTPSPCSWSFSSLVRPGFTLDASSESAVRMMSAPGWHPARARAGRRLVADAHPAADRGRARRPVRPSGPGSSGCRPPSADPRGVDRVEPHAAGLLRPDRLAPARRVRRRVRLEAAQAVAVGGTVAPDHVLDALGRLVDKSLVVAEERDGEARYRLWRRSASMPPTGWSRPGEAAATRDRHLAWFLAFSEATRTRARRDLAAWRTRLEREHDNLARPSTGAGGVRPGTRSPPGGWVAVALAYPATGPRGLRVPVAGHRAGAGRPVTLQARLLTGIALVADTASPLGLEFDARRNGPWRSPPSKVMNHSARSASRCRPSGRFYTDFEAA